MNDQEVKLLKSIQRDAEIFIAKHGYVPYQLTVSDHEYEIYKGIVKQGKRASINFAGVLWQINIQCCKVVLAALDQAWGRDL